MLNDESLTKKLSKLPFIYFIDNEDFVLKKNNTSRIFIVRFCVDFNNNKLYFAECLLAKQKF
jgi:hypothetical protein